MIHRPEHPDRAQRRHLREVCSQAALLVGALLLASLPLLIVLASAGCNFGGGPLLQVTLDLRRGADANVGTWEGGKGPETQNTRGDETGEGAASIAQPTSSPAAATAEADGYLRELGIEPG